MMWCDMVDVGNLVLKNKKKANKKLLQTYSNFMILKFDT
jgi:hypothetical protein